MLGIPAYLYRLVPANPILLRVVSVAGKRRRDLGVRAGYLGLLIILVIFTLVGGEGLGGDLDQLSRTSTDVFIAASYLQLALVSLLAPIFTAGAITQEKDAQTYDVLLATPLTNGQIVLGTLLSRLFFVFVLLLSGIPVFSITQIFGGVGVGEIWTSFLIAAATATLTGALAVAIATFKVGTRRTIFSFYLLIVTYLVGVFLLDYLDAFRVTVRDAAGNYTALGQTGWLTGLHPFLALQSVLDPVHYAPPGLADLPPDLRRWPTGFFLTRPAVAFVTLAFLISLALVAPSILLLRRLAQSSLTLRSWAAERLARLPGLSRAGSRRVRSVWNNPIAWREAKTKASSTRGGLLRYAFILAGLAGAIVVCALYASQTERPRRFISPGGYDPINLTLLVDGDVPDTFALSPDLQVTLDGNPVSPDLLRGRYVVDNVTSNVVGGTRVLDTIRLAQIPRRLDAPTARQYLLGMVFLEVAVILLIVTNAAASTVTREREDGTLDLLLTTPITSRYYLWGKLRGLVSFAVPLMIVPVISCAVFVVYDLLDTVVGRGGRQWLVLPESLLLMPVILVILAAFASTVGISLSLRQKTTVRAVMTSLAIVIGLFALLGWCGYQFINSAVGEVGIVLGAFSPLTVILVLIDPATFGGRLFLGDFSDAIRARIILFTVSLAACAGYAAIIGSLYKSMVYNFDMTIRKQQR